MIRLLEIAVLISLCAGFFWFCDTGIDLVRTWLARRAAERLVAKDEFQRAVRSHKRVRVAETLAIHSPALTRRERKILEELRDDILFEDEVLKQNRQKANSVTVQNYPKFKKDDLKGTSKEGNEE